MQEGRKAERPERTPTTSFRNCHILNSKNSSPNRDLNPHSSTSDRRLLGKQTCWPLLHASTLFHKLIILFIKLIFVILDSSFHSLSFSSSLIFYLSWPTPGRAQSFSNRYPTYPIPTRLPNYTPRRPHCLHLFPDWVLTHLFQSSDFLSLMGSNPRLSKGLFLAISCAMGSCLAPSHRSLFLMSLAIGSSGCSAGSCW